MSNAPEQAIEYVLQTRWSDQDLLGHINNARIITLVEEARVRAMYEHLGAMNSLEQSEPGSTVIRAMNIEFERPVHYPDPVVIKIWVGKIGNTSYTVHHELLQNGKRCVYVEAVLVVFDVSTGRSLQLTDTRRAQLENLSQKGLE